MRKTSVSGQIVSEILAQLCSDKPIQTVLYVSNNSNNNNNNNNNNSNNNNNNNNNGLISVIHGMALRLK